MEWRPAVSFHDTNPLQSSPAAAHMNPAHRAQQRSTTQANENGSTPHGLEGRRHGKG